VESDFKSPTRQNPPRRDMLWRGAASPKCCLVTALESRLAWDETRQHGLCPMERCRQPQGDTRTKLQSYSLSFRSFRFFELPT